MTVRAHGTRAMRAHPLTYWPVGGNVPVERRDIRKRGRWRRSDDVAQDPDTTNDGRRACRIGGDGEDATLPQQSTAPAVASERDPPETAAIDVGNPVMLR